MNDQSEFDITAELGDALSGTDKLRALHNLAEEAIALERAIFDTEGVLKAQKAALQTIKTRRMPDLQMEIQQPLFVYHNRQFYLSDYVSGSLPKEEHAEARRSAISYLGELGEDGLIKTMLTVPFGKSQHNEALDLYEQLKETGYPVSIESGVHAQTLQAFARRKLEDGEKIDWERLGLFVGKVTRIDELDPKTGKKLSKKQKLGGDEE